MRRETQRGGDRGMWGECPSSEGAASTQLRPVAVTGQREPSVAGLQIFYSEARNLSFSVESPGFEMLATSLSCFL